MAKFINRKEKTYDFKLTSYGHYLLSIGYFKPVYYAFFDDNIVYDAQYANITNEHQNEIQNRIKNETPYLEGQTVFQDLENKGINWVGEGSSGYYKGDVTPMMEIPREDSFRIEGMLGDAWFEGKAQTAPAWKIVVLDGLIKSSSAMDTKNEVHIPQINVELDYQKVIKSYDFATTLTNTDYEKSIRTSAKFSDGNVIQLIPDDLMIYAEESNTALLTENFDIEIFEILSGGLTTYPNPTDVTNMDALRRLYFEKDFERIQGGIYNEEAYNRNVGLSYTTQSVDYYFNVQADKQVDAGMACKAAEIFNNESYYIDLDFECNPERMDPVYNDIYGPVTEPEICL